MTWTESKPVYAVVIKIASDNIIRDRVYVDEAKNQFVFGVPVNTIEEHVEARKREFFKPPEEEEPFRFVVEPQMPPDDYVEERYGTSSPGERSTASNGFMSRLDCRMGAGIQIGKETYIPVTGNIHSFSNPKKKVVSVGSSIDREIIVLDQDPTKCPLLATHFMTLKGELLAAKAKNGDKPLSTEQVLQHVKTYVRGKIFPSCRDRKLMAKFEAFLNKARQTKGRPTTNHRDHPGRPIPFIWVDEVIKEDAGVCRHHALVTCYLLDRLTKGKNPILSGTVTHLRENVPGGAHIWTVFIPKGSKTEKWHLDTMWGVLENFVNPDAVSRLKKSYGDAAIDSQIYRTQHL